MTTLNTGADAVTVEFDFTPEDQVEFSLYRFTRLP